MQLGAAWWLELLIGFTLLCTIEALASIQFCIRHTPGASAPHELSPCPPLQFHERDAGAGSNDIIIDFACTDAKQEICAKAQATIAKANDIIASTIQFVAPVRVRASFLSFCKAYKDCGTGKSVRSIGRAYPAVSYLMTDLDDNTTYMYPQAIVKQLTELPFRPGPEETDINAEFNSDIDWYFVDSSGDIKNNENDLLLTVTHELVHGLGFVSAWDDDIYQRFSVYAPEVPPFLTPAPLVPPNETPSVRDAYNKSEGVAPFWGFVEFPLDRYLSSKSQGPLSQMAKTLNTWGEGNVMFSNILDMVNAWFDSGPVRQTAENVYMAATTPYDIRLQVGDNTILWMETSLVPFEDGSSLMHVDDKTYDATSDYLMVYDVNRGVTMASLDSRYGSGPLGPQLTQALALLGYNIQPAANITIPTPTYNLTYWEPSPDLVGTVTNPSPALSVDPIGPARMPTATPTSSSSSSVISSLQHKTLAASALISSVLVIPQLLLHL